MHNSPFASEPLLPLKAPEAKVSRDKNRLKIH